jgi:hypothetical protein
MQPIEYIAYQLTHFNEPAIIKITKSQWEHFLKEFTFAKIKGERLGNFFCKKFNIRNIYLTTVENDDSALHYINAQQMVEE